MVFTNPYDLHGDGPGGTSALLTDPVSGLSGRITTRAISPGGGTVYVGSNLLGINSPGADGDNLFEPGESWTFSWDQEVVLTSMAIDHWNITPWRGEFLVSIQSDAWIDKPWVNTGSGGDVVYSFDPQTGTFLMARNPVSGQTRVTLTFDPASQFVDAILRLPVNTPITFRNQGQSFADIRSMSFSIGPGAATDTNPPAISSPTILQINTVPPGSSTQLRVTATGAAPLLYQWFLNGPTQPLIGSNTDVLSLSDIQPAQAGTYTVVVSNAFGTVTNRGMVLNVLPPGPGGLIGFTNGIPTTNGLVFDLSVTNPVSPGASILAQLYMGLDAANLQPAGGTAAFFAAGRIAGGTRRVPATAPGQTVFAQVRCWAAAFGASYAQALEAGGPIGNSIVFPVTPPLITNVAAPLIGLQNFALVPGLPPQIIQEPQSLTVTQGMDATFGVSGGGSGPRSFQWLFNGEPLAGASNATLVLPLAQPEQSGAYALVVSNRFGTATSLDAQLVVLRTNRPPVAQPGAFGTAEDQPVAVLLAATDPDGDALAYTVAPPQFGVLTGAPPQLLYTPPPNFFGDDSIRFKVSDGQFESAFVTVRIDVQPVNDAPVAQPQSMAVDENRATGITLVASDADGDALTYSVTPPAHGTLAGVAPNLTYTPVPNYNGPDSFTFKVKDTFVDSGIATVSISVRPVDDLPVAIPLTLAIDEDTPLSLTLSVANPDRLPLVYSFTAPAHGIIGGVAPSLVYHPAPNYNGPDSFTFSVRSSLGESAPATVSITVNSVNDRPVPVVMASPLAVIGSADTNWIVISPNGSNAPVTLDASLSSDVDNDSLTFAWYEVGTGVEFGFGIRVTNVFSIGFQRVTLAVIDSAQAHGEATVEFEVLSPGQAVEVVLLRLNDSGLPRQTKRPLLATLKAAIASYDRGQLHTANNQLRAFLNKVRAQIAPVEPSLAKELTRACKLIVDVVER